MASNNNNQKNNNQNNNNSPEGPRNKQMGEAEFVAKLNVVSSGHRCDDIKDLTLDDIKEMHKGNTPLAQCTKTKGDNDDDKKQKSSK